MRATLSVKRQNVNNSDVVCMNWNLDCTVWKKKGMILLPIPNKLRIPELKTKGYNVLPPPGPSKQKVSSKKNVKKCKQTVPWNKSSSSSCYSDSIRKDTPTSSKFETGFTRNRSDVGKKDDDRIATSRIASKYNSYGANYQRDTASTRDTGSYSQSGLPRIKTTLEKKDTSHPPVSYRPVSRTTTSRSRDPSPISQSEKSSSSSYNTSRLFPRAFSRSVSRERLEATSPVPTLSKYTGRSSINRDELAPTKYTTKSETTSKYGSIRSTKEDKIPRISSTRASRDELPSTTTQKYITSRFLPKNSVEKSYTAYTRPSSVRAKETSRKNRELLSVLQAQHDQDKSRSVSRCSSVAPEDSCSRDKSRSDETSTESRRDSKVQEMETVTVITRGTSPTPSRQGSFLRKRCEVARVTEKQITRPKIRTNMVDKEIQSDRLDDSTKSSRFAGASRMTAPHWSSILDMKFSNQKGSKKQNDPNERNMSKQSDSPKSISRNSSSKSITNSKSDKSKDITNKSSSPSPPKNKAPSSKSSSSADKKQLPPAIPKSDSTGKPNSHSINVNKDFRKSVLNMNPDGKSKKIGRRSTSVSSADSDGGEAQTSEATDVSENLTSCKSFHKSSSSSKLPQKISSDNVGASRRSPSSDASTASSSPASGSEEEARIKNENTSKKTKSKGSSRTSACVSSADELSTDKSLKPPAGPRHGKEAMKEAEAKSFLMRALAPVTNLFKQKHSDSTDKVNLIDVNDSSKIENVVSQDPQNVSGDNHKNQKSYRMMRRVESGERAWWLEDPSQNIDKTETFGFEESENSVRQQKPHKLMRRVESGEKAWWLEESPQNSEEVQECKSEQKKPFKIMCRVDSGEKAWWLEEPPQTPPASQSDTSLRDANNSQGSRPERRLKMKHIDSGELPWWLDENAEIPEGIEVYPNYVRSDGTTEDGRVIYKIRRNDSGKTEWWLDSSESTSNNKDKSENIMDAEYLERHKIRHIDSGERAWWISSSENIPDQCEKEEESITEHKPVYAIRRQDSGEKPWWLQDDNGIGHDDFDETQIPLGDRASPEGLEMPKDDEGRASPYDNIPKTQSKAKRPSNLFISKHTNIDEILGTGCQIWSPLIDSVFSYPERSRREECTEISPAQVKIHEGIQQKAYKSAVQKDDMGAFPKAFSPYGKLDDAALQLYKDGDYGSYLDLEASISEQQEEFEGFQSNKKNSIVLRTQLSVRVHTIIEKLLTSEGRELRRALFSLKNIFQEDKDLVHEFVQNDGLSCLIKVGSEADQNYQNYILRALGQVMLYVDGMNGVMEHNQTIQWLYSLISSKFRLVVKTALKLLLVFVEYTDSNCMLLIQAINTVDYSQGLLPWYNIMKLLRDFDSADTELLIYATTLINKVLNGIPDQDTYYDQTDALEEQGIEPIIQRYMSKPGTDLDLLQQFQIYEAVLRYEDGEEIGGAPIRHLDESIRKTLRSRKSVGGPSERRKSRRHSTGTAPLYSGFSKNNSLLQASQEDDESSSSQSSGLNSQLNGSYKDSHKASDAGVTPALRRRRERAERQRSFMKEQQESAALLRSPSQNGIENHEMTNGNYTNGLQQRIANSNNILNRSGSRKDMTPLMNAVNKLDSDDINKQPWILYKSDDKNQMENSENTNDNERNVLLQLKRENTVKDLTQKLANQNMLHSPSDENKVNRIGDMSGLISKAKEGLAKSKSKADLLKSPTSENIPKLEAKKSENELRWEELAANLDRTLNLCDMDFTDLLTDDEVDVLAPAAVSNGIPPPPPPLLLKENGAAPPPPPLANRGPPPVPNPPVFGISLQRNKSMETKIPIKKNKKTVKLFWKEVRDDPISAVKLKGGSIWDELSAVTVDTQKLEHLFESRAKDLITKKQQEMNKNKEIIVLDPKRSNAINIGMTKLPPPRSIKTAILKMDATIMNREGIEKLLTMLPTEEERTKIQEAQAANPDLPLGSAEQFLLTLASISELPARLRLWAFKLDFENSEREIAEPLMDLKQGIEVLKINKTFRGILSTLLSIGNFLNGNEVKGFQIEYLAKVPEVKDTVHKHSLLHHLCHIVMEKFPDATDLYSEIGAITRASKIDFDELTLNVQRLEEDCKASWDHLKLIAKHDGSTMMKVKMSDFLSDCAERIILLGIIHRRIINRFHKFLLWLGIPLHQISETKPNEFCRVVSEFALEYRTTRERVLQQLEKKANHRERNKTRGKMITDIGKFRTKEDRADAELRQLLGSDLSDVESLQGTLPWRRTRRENNRSFMGTANGNLTDGDDEILESLVKTATKGPSRTAPRERKRTRHADRKSLRRTLKNGLSEEEKRHLSAYIKGY